MGTASATVSLAAIAIDAEDGDFSDSIQWQSNINGPLGSGNNITALLTTGSHIISLSITDSSGNVIQVSRNDKKGEVYSFESKLGELLRFTIGGDINLDVVFETYYIEKHS